MPRGVYARRSAQPKTARKDRRQPAPVLAAASPAIAPAQAPAQIVVPDAPRQFSREDFRRSVDDMDGPLLKAYARHIGIQQRDVDGLSEDRLRQNCKARIVANLED